MRKAPSAETYKLLYARSGNECAFPECTHPIFNDNGLYIAELCHIKAANKGGQRYDENQTDNERNALENLLFLCHRHHKETDDVEKFTVDTLLEMKSKHESQFTEQGKKLTQKMLQQIENEIESFWCLQSSKFLEGDEYKILGNFKKDALQVLNDLEIYVGFLHNSCLVLEQSDDYKTLVNDLKHVFEKANLDFSEIEDFISRDDKFIFRNWETHSLSIRNTYYHIQMYLRQLSIKIIELLLLNDPNNLELKKLLNSERNNFDDLYSNLYYAD